MLSGKHKIVEGVYAIHYLERY